MSLYARGPTMKHSTARKIKSEVVSRLTDFIDTADATFGNYSNEEREYAIEIVKRIAAGLNVKSDKVPT